jgi:hypothetical protein
MAGSLRFFNYKDDAGVPMGLRLDESNTEKVNSIVDLGNTVTAGLRGRPQGFQPRHIFIQSDNNLINRKCTVLSAAQYNSLAVGAQFLLTAGGWDGVAADTVVTIRRKVPERLRNQPWQGDSGQLDGDNP